MAKLQFRNLKDLEKYAKKKVEEAMQSQSVASVFKTAMQQNVYTEVYDAYDPLQYERRDESDGLADQDNMFFTKHVAEGKRTLVSLFENMTLGNERVHDPEVDGQIYGNKFDSMSGQFISSLIEHGSTNMHTSNANTENGWYSITHSNGKTGEWTYPRPFAFATAQTLNNPTLLNKVLKEALEYGINN